MKKNCDNIQFPVLIGDIGGTNGRFQILIDAHAEPKNFPDILTGDFNSAGEAIQASVLDKTSLFPRSVILAAAGVITADSLEMTNCSWSIKPAQLIGELAVDDVILLNDFEAQALAAASYRPDDIVPIGGNMPESYASRVVVGPGTGLGVAGLIHACNCWIPVPGEGGHVDFGPQTNRDFELWPYLQKHKNRISAEQLVSGRGIVNIYQALSRLQGLTPKFTEPEDITTAAKVGSDPVASDAVEQFCCYLGRIAGDLAITFMATGGVFIAGGICQHIAEFLANSGFRREFENKPPHRELLRNIPAYLVTHPSAALAGLAAFARDPSRFGIETESCRWRASQNAAE